MAALFQPISLMKHFSFISFNGNTKTQETPDLNCNFLLNFSAKIQTYASCWTISHLNTHWGRSAALTEQSAVAVQQNRCGSQTAACLWPEKHSHTVSTHLFKSHRRAARVADISPVHLQYILSKKLQYVFFIGWSWIRIVSRREHQTRVYQLTYCTHFALLLWLSVYGVKLWSRLYSRGFLKLGYTLQNLKDSSELIVRCHMTGSRP